MFVLRKDLCGNSVAGAALAVVGIIDEADFAGSFGLYMDASHPSCRSLDRSYTGENKKNFQFYVIDGFIVSANVRVDRLENLDLEFACTDHNPVVLDLTLTE